ncbi:uncharacterized protein LOC104858701 isoform X1 [Fukomys damarensis]|uniref:uncharacterized protein LOC104858701 isoform X1 n=1 Tax=Fukomys damarensis TaxID=885580 RepID=UPI00053F7CF1|nr:uncharacterized protein LOC104858701 isoform X1 [Fukomys damarensis]
MWRLTAGLGPSQTQLKRRTSSELCGVALSWHGDLSWSPGGRRRREKAPRSAGMIGVHHQASFGAHFLDNKRLTLFKDFLAQDPVQLMVCMHPAPTETCENWEAGLGWTLRPGGEQSFSTAFTPFHAHSESSSTLSESPRDSGALASLLQGVRDSECRGSTHPPSQPARCSCLARPHRRPTRVRLQGTTQPRFGPLSLLSQGLVRNSVQPSSRQRSIQPRATPEGAVLPGGRGTR